MLEYPAIHVILVSVFLPLLATCAVALRMYLRRAAEITGLGASEYFIFACLFVSWAIGIDVIIGGAVAHIGYPKKELTAAQMMVNKKVYFAAHPLYVTAVSLVKISLLFFYMNIFTTRKFRIICHVFIGIITAWATALVLVSIFQCNPIRKYWTPGLPGTQLDNHFLFIFAAVSAIVLDACILALPLPIIGRLHMRTTKKWLVAGIFMLGSFCLLAAIVRLVYLINLFGGVAQGKVKVFTNESVNALLWLVIEPCASIIAACLPTYGGLLRSGGGVESILRSVRSIASLRSWSSRGSLDHEKQHSAKTDTYSPSTYTAQGTVNGWRNASTTTEVSNEKKPSGVDEENQINVRVEYGVA